jgi:hypothetical protein
MWLVELKVSMEAPEGPPCGLTDQVFVIYPDV